MSFPRSTLLVSGAPASGKSTVALALAQALPFALLSKDRIKEALHDSRQRDGGGDLLQVSRELSIAAMEVLWALAPACPLVILEANFRPKSMYERGRVESLPGRRLEVFCDCPPDEAARRFAHRASTERHHAAHALKAIPLQVLAEYNRPIGLSEVITVDTTRPVEIPALLQAIRKHWPEF